MTDLEQLDKLVKERDRELAKANRQIARAARRLNKKHSLRKVAEAMGMSHQGLVKFLARNR